MKKQYLGLILVLLFGCQQKKPIKFKEYDFKFIGMTFNGKPYKFSEEIEEIILKEKGNQFAAFEYSYIGEIEKTLKMWDINNSISEELTEEERKTFKAHDSHAAIPHIVKEADKHQIVIINEAHHKPQHRVFTTRLLQDLFNIGYRHIGLEGLLNSLKSDSLLNSHNYPVMENGYYIKEPQFGNLVRQAQKIGYKVFSYESLNNTSAKEREINQARNIEKYINAYPKDKVLIHCGLAHGTEGNLGNKWEKAMAGRLSEFTGINPLSINQTTYSETGTKELENPYYGLTEVMEPTIYTNKKEEVFGRYKNESWFDISVFHPRTRNYNLPEWLLFDKRKEVIINLEDAPIKFPCLVLAYLQSEKIGYAVPYDVRESRNKQVTLVLENEKYNIILLNREEESLLFEYGIYN